MYLRIAVLYFVLWAQLSVFVFLLLLHVQSETSQRSCTVKVQQGVHLVRLSISFPSHYPYGAAPSFSFDRNSTTIDIASQQELNQVCG